MAKIKKRKAGPGRYRFAPTDQEREQVRSLAGYGIPQAQICKLISRPIAVSTLRHAFRDELDAGLAQANSAVAQSLYQQAVGMPAQYDEKGKLVRKELDRVPSCGIFWAKARMGWRDVNVTRLEGTGKGGAILHQHDLQHLSDDDLRSLEAIHDKLEAARARAARGDQGGVGETKH